MGFPLKLLILCSWWFKQKQTHFEKNDFIKMSESEDDSMEPASKNIVNDMSKSGIINNAKLSVKTGMKWNNGNKTEFGDSAAVQAPVMDQIQHPVTVWAVLDKLDNLGTECQVSSTPAVDQVQSFSNHANMDRTPSQIAAMLRHSMRGKTNPISA